MPRRPRPAPSPRRPELILLLAALAAAVLATACGPPSPEEEAAQQETIQAFLEEYLPRLAEAYRTGEVELLDPYAAKKEQAVVAHRVRELAKTGEVLAPELVSVQVEDVTTWSEVNAYVTTVEVWNIRTFASGTENVVREELGQSNRVKYQLKREDGQWRVFWRELQETFPS